MKKSKTQSGKRPVARDKREPVASDKAERRRLKLKGRNSKTEIENPESTIQTRKARATAEELGSAAVAAQEEKKGQLQFPVVGLGASAGGLEAFTDFLEALPGSTGMAFVLVQHLDPKHGSVLPDILSRATKLPVAGVTDGLKIEPNCVYVMPANTDMTLEDGVLKLAARHLTEGRHLPIDHFFKSLAEERRERAIGVILSGTASDGTAGCQAIKAAGGITFAQDEKSAKYSSMPRSAVFSGSVDFILSPKSIARELARISRHPYLVHHPTLRQEAGEPGQAPRPDELTVIFAMLLDATGVDFTHYKQSTIRRRVSRRMALNRLESVRDYVGFIRTRSGELDELYKDILIHVTGFYRDSAMFDVLSGTVLPALLARRSESDPVRIWVAGCSTGEEVYSILITVLEYLWDVAKDLPIASAGAKAFQIFATDISDASLQRARAGLYSESEMAGISPERKKRFFTRADGGYQINKPVREMCVFARHNITKDPPFSNLDIISCRNLLIYLGPDLQKRVIPALHYALKHNGYLMLGESETPGAFADHFTLVDRKAKIYQKKRMSPRLIPYFGPGAIAAGGPAASAKAKEPEIAGSIERQVDHVLSSRYMPPNVVVNEDLEIIQIRGKTGAYLEPAPGVPTFSLVKMAREGLLVDLREALSKARKENAPVRKDGVRVRSNGGTRELSLEVVPLKGASEKDRYYVVVFQEPPRALGPKEARQREKAAREKASRGTEQEVQHLRDQLQAVIEEHESTQEDFRAANEEVVSANEELQSTNEELETAKEELQSSNEELITLNDELKNRNAELGVANNDLANVLASVDIPIVIVNHHLQVRRFTPAAEKLLNLITGDVGRRLSEIRPNLEIEDLSKLASEAIEGAAIHERELKEKNGKWYLARSRPYKTWDNKIDGAVVSFQDIDALKRSLDQLRLYASAVIEHAPEPLLILDSGLRVSVANEAFYKEFQVGREETEGRAIYELGTGQWDNAKLRARLAEVFSTRARVDNFEVEFNFPHVGWRTMLVHAHLIEPEPGSRLIQLGIRDVTEKRALESMRSQAALLDLVGAAVIVRDHSGVIQYWNLGAQDLYGWTKEEAIGRNIADVLKTEFPKPVEEIQREATRSARWEGELVQYARDGTRLQVTSRWAPQPGAEGSPPGILEVNSDVTALKDSERGLRTLSGQLIRTQDVEQRRIARELHDSVGQKLVALKMALNATRKEVEKAKVRSGLSESLKFTDQIMKEVSSMAYLLHPPMLEDVGLVSAIRWVVDGMGKRAGVAVEFSVPRTYKRLRESSELALFRVAQESLTNVIRHSRAHKVRIRLEQTAREVKLEVSDDGKGIPVTEDGRQKVGIGLAGMKERMAHVGGTLEIKSSGKGTVIRAILPLHS